MTSENEGNTNGYDHDYLRSFRSQLDVAVEDRFEVEEYEVIDWIRVLHAGWECDSFAALVRLPDGRKEIVFADGTGSQMVNLEEQIAEYEKAIVKTRAFLQKYKEA